MKDSRSLSALCQILAVCDQDVEKSVPTQTSRSGFWKADVQA